jgi:alcohol dehydrogenase class IV
VADFEIATANRIVFGRGVLDQVGPAAALMGQVALVASGLPEALNQPLLNLLAQHGLSVRVFAVSGEPTIASVQAGCALARQVGAEVVIGLGGGSAIDSAKAIAILLTNPGEPLDYLEVVGRGQPLQKPGLPVIAIPTTAGTGAEVTRNAVLGVPEQGVKASLRSPHMLPRLALIDPQLTDSLPPAVTASTGMDALTQLIEPFVSRRANPFSDALCREGLSHAAGALLPAYQPDATRPERTRQARDDMALASLFGGLALANAGLGAVHGFASVLGGMFAAPHGAVCARLLPAVMAKNLGALQARDPGSPALRRYDQVAGILMGQPGAPAVEGVEWVRKLAEALQIPALSDYGLTKADFSEVVEKTSRASSTQSNPIRLSAAELHSILEMAL